MSKYFAKVSWKKAPDESFIDQRYSRGHEWHFDGGVIVPASSSPHIVPLPYSVENNVDPEEAFVASLSSCHMLFFLSIAAKRRYIIESYIDEAIGIIDTNEEGQQAMTLVTFRPKVIFIGDKKPTLAHIEKLHHQAHQQCFIANSVKTKVVTEIV